MKSSNEKLIESAESGDIEAVRECITLGADVNTKDDKGQTVLDIAHEKEYTTIVKYLESFK